MTPANEPESAVPISREETPRFSTEEIEQQRRRSALLLNDFASALYKSASRVTGRAGHSVASAAQHLQERYSREITGVGRFLLNHPGSCLVTAVLAGYTVGLVFRRR